MARDKTNDQARDHEILLANFRELLKTKAGKAIIWEILSMCGIYNNTFQGNSNTFFLEGKRAIGLEILSLMNDADNEAYAKLQLEKAKEESK